jgi:hypothetical protein
MTREIRRIAHFTANVCGAIRDCGRRPRAHCLDSYRVRVHERAARRNWDLVEHSWRSIGCRIVAVPRWLTARSLSPTRFSR